LGSALLSSCKESKPPSDSEHERSSDADSRDAGSEQLESEDDANSDSSSDRSDDEVAIIDHISCEPCVPCLLSRAPTDNAAWGISLSSNAVVYINRSEDWAPDIINRKLTVVRLSDLGRYFAKVDCQSVPGANWVFIAKPQLFESSVGYLCHQKYKEGMSLQLVDSTLEMLDLATGKVNHIPFRKVGLKENIQVNGDHAVWEYHAEDKSVSIFAQDLKSKETFSVSAEGSLQGGVALSGSKVAFRDGYLKSAEIWLYDLSQRKAQQITQDEELQDSPDISNDRLVWMDTRDGTWNADETYTNSNIYSHTISTGVTERLTSDPSWQEQPSIDGDLVAWTDLRHGGRDAGFWYQEAEIYLKVIGTGQERRVTSLPGNDFSPVVKGNNIVWLHETVPGNRWGHDLYFIPVSCILGKKR